MTAEILALLRTCPYLSEPYAASSEEDGVKVGFAGGTSRELLDGTHERELEVTLSLTRPSAYLPYASGELTSESLSGVKTLENAIVWLESQTPTAPVKKLSVKKLPSVRVKEQLEISECVLLFTLETE